MRPTGLVADLGTSLSPQITRCPLQFALAQCTHILTALTLTNISLCKIRSFGVWSEATEEKEYLPVETYLAEDRVTLPRATLGGVAMYHVGWQGPESGLLHSLGFISCRSLL